jgi:hypothetical protein
MAHSGEGQRSGMSAAGGSRHASIRANAVFDPLRKSGGPKCCDAQREISIHDVVVCDPRIEGSTLHGASSKPPSQRKWGSVSDYAHLNELRTSSAEVFSRH